MSDSHLVPDPCRVPPANAPIALESAAPHAGFTLVAPEPDGRFTMVRTLMINEISLGNPGRG